MVRSNPDYVNELDPKIVDMLIDFHKSQCTLKTPEAQGFWAFFRYFLLGKYLSEKLEFFGLFVK